MTEFNPDEPAIISIDSSQYDDDQVPFQQSVRSLLQADVPNVETAVSPSDILVLVRTNSRAEECVAALEELDIPAYRASNDGIEGTIGGALLDFLEAATVYQRTGDMAGNHEFDTAVRWDGTASETITNPNSLFNQIDGHARILRRLYGFPEGTQEQLKAACIDGSLKPYELIRQELGTGPDGLSIPGVGDAELESRLHQYLQDMKTLSRTLAHRSLVGALEGLITTLGLPDDIRSTPSIEAIQLAAEAHGIDDTPTQCTKTAIQNVRAAASVSTPGHGVEVSTIHSAKGTEEQVVVMPDLKADEWQIHDLAGWADTTDQLRRVSRGVRGLSEQPTRSLARREADNERRLAYVGITRPRELLVLIGESTGGTGGGSVPDLDSYLGSPDTTTVGDYNWDVWAELQAALPADAMTWQPTDSQPPAWDGGAAASLQDALDTARAAAASEPEQIDVTDTTREPADAETVARRYSFTAVTEASNCDRRALLAGVLDAPGLSDADGSGGKDGAAGPNPRIIGVLVHEAAERVWGLSTDRDDWQGALETVATEHGVDDPPVLAAAEERIDQLFARGWQQRRIVGREEPFAIEVAGREVTGKIDAIEMVDGDLRPIDLKTGARDPDPLQLAIYQLAIERDEQLRSRWPDADVLAGQFLSVHPDKVGAIDYPEGTEEATLESTSAAHARPHVESMASLSYDEPMAGPHCADCPYAYLGCAQEGER